MDADERVVVSPVDGAVSEAGIVEGGECLQAKGLAFPVAALLGDAAEAGAFAEGGTFATLYLSPRDYHRVHAPLGGAILGWPLPAGRVVARESSQRAQRAAHCLRSTSGW